MTIPSRIMEEQLDDELVLFDPETDQIMNLNGTAAYIWVQLKDGASFPEIHRQICEAFPDASQEEVQEDIRGFVQEMRDEGFLETSGDSKPP